MSAEYLRTRNLSTQRRDEIRHGIATASLALDVRLPMIALIAGGALTGARCK